VSRRTALAAGLAALTLVGLQAVAPTAVAQTWPVKPIRFVFPWPAGGADVVPRVLAELLTEDLGQNVLLDNRPGAGGTVGTALVAKAPADGYTLLVSDMSSHAIAGALHRNLPFDGLKDFAPVALAASSPMLLVANPAANVKTVADLVALAKAKPGKIAYASSGNGAITHLAAERLRRLAGIDLVHVPYKGSAPAVAAVLAGDTAIAFSTVPPVLGHARAGKLVPIGVSLAGELPQLPGVPAIAASVPGFSMGLHQGVLAPAGTPESVITRLHAGIASAMQHPRMVEAMRANAMQPNVLAPAAFRAFLERESASWTALVREVGLTVD
jgi:tripartite-type tricarboxylate transporter receptor subunit TctC